MNKIDVIIKKVSSSGGVILVDLEAENCPMSALLINVAENPDWLTEGNEIYAVFKETEVSIAKNFTGDISLRNKLPCIIQNIKYGQLMSVITAQFKQFTISSAITTRSVNMLGLKPGDEILALIKSNEITLMKK